MTRQFIVSVLLTAPTCSTAVADDKKDTPEVRGTILKVLGEHLVLDADKPVRKLEIDAARDVEVTIDGRESDLKSLQPGMRVRIVRGKDGKAVSVSAERNKEKGKGGEVKGIIRRATPTSGGTRLMLESAAGEAYTYQIPTDAKVSIAEEKSGPEKLAAGMPASLTLNSEGTVREVTAQREPDRNKEGVKGEVPGLVPGRSSEQYDVAAGRSIPFAGTFEGTFAYRSLLGHDYGQQSDDSAYVRPLYRHPLHPWTRNILPRKKAYQRAAQTPGQPDPYVEAFLRNDGRGDRNPNAGNEVPSYEAWYWRNPSSRYIPLSNRYRHNFHFELGAQEPSSTGRR